MFQLIIGVRQNHLKRAGILRMTADTQSIMDRFSFVAKHNAMIRVCAVCNIRELLVGVESKILSISNNSIELLKFDVEDLKALTAS